MENDVNMVNVDDQNETVDESDFVDNEGEEESTDESEGEDTSDDQDKDWKAEAAKWKAIAGQNKKKLDAQNAEDKSPANQDSKQDESDNDSSPLTKDEAILYAKGLEDDEVEKAKKIAQIEGISVREAEQSELYVSWKEKKDRDAKLKKSALAASKGSKSQTKVTLDTPGLTKDQHKELWKSKNG